MTAAPAVAAADDAPDRQRLTRSERRVAGVVALGGLLAVLDTTIVVVAMPRFMAVFDVGLAAAQWIVVGYSLGMVCAMAVAVPVAERSGARRVYIAALLLFAAATSWAGMTNSLGELIAARVLQGLGGGFINPVGMALAFGAVEPRRRARITAITGLPLLIGPIAGPVLGGVVLQGSSWRTLFWITVPPALLAAFGAMSWIPRSAGTLSIDDPQARQGRVAVTTSQEHGNGGLTRGRPL